MCTPHCPSPSQLPSNVWLPFLKAAFPEVQDDSLLLSTFVENQCQIIPTIKALRSFGLIPNAKVVEPIENPPPSSKSAKKAKQPARQVPKPMSKYYPLRAPVYDRPDDGKVINQDLDADELMNLSRDFAEMRNEVFRQAARSFQGGNGAIAAQLSKQVRNRLFGIASLVNASWGIQKGRQYEEKMREVQILAARKLFYTSRYAVLMI